MRFWRPKEFFLFRITQKQADAGLLQWLKSRWFAPGALKQFAQPDAITGVYLPFWTYDTHTTSYYTGERGEYYFTTETYTERDAQGRQVTRTRQVRQTRWRPASGAIPRWFDDVLVPAATSLPQNRLDGLEPWDLMELKSYDPAFLSGFKAQRYQVDLTQGFERVKQTAAGVIKGDVRKNIGGDEQRIHEITTQYSAITFKHLLLPVYAGAYSFNQKVFQIIVNGRTGEIQGDRPYSFGKIALLVLSILFIILILVISRLLLSHFFIGDIRPSFYHPTPPRREELMADTERREQQISEILPKATSSAADTVGRILWVGVLLGAGLGLFSFVSTRLSATEISAPQLAALAAESLALAAVPYVIARAWDEVCR